MVLSACFGPPVSHHARWGKGVLFGQPSPPCVQTPRSLCSCAATTPKDSASLFQHFYDLHSRHSSQVSQNTFRLGGRGLFRPSLNHRKTTTLTQTNTIPHKPPNTHSKHSQGHMCFCKLAFILSNHKTFRKLLQIMLTVHRRWFTQKTTYKLSV